MPFNTVTFLIFFLGVSCILAIVKSWKFKKCIILVASILFYAAWNPLFVVLLIGSTLVDFFIGIRLFESSSRAARRRWVAASLVINLGLLSVFKYSQFLIDSFASFSSMLGFSFIPVDLGILLPVGISFYTFQTLSYTLDIYRKEIEPTRSILDYSVFVTYFPQLVAGPIVRASQFLPQLAAVPKVTMEHKYWGMLLFLTGLFCKVVLADYFLAPVSDAVFSTTSDVGSIGAWAGVLAFGGQIFFDFSGYSTCAIGLALIMGFALPDNFWAPYGAIGFRDFWRRWHISLSTWLRDYLYISLGGSKNSRITTYRNITITMLLGGLWHGASFMFIFWGALHACYLVLERLCLNVIPRRVREALWAQCVGWLITVVGIFVAWVPFRAESMTAVSELYSKLFFPTQGITQLSSDSLFMVFVLMIWLFAWHLWRRERSFESVVASISPATKLVWATFMLVSLFLFGAGDDRAFIYFQF